MCSAMSSLRPFVFRRNELKLAQSLKIGTVCMSKQKGKDMFFHFKQTALCVLIVYLNVTVP